MKTYLIDLIQKIQEFVLDYCCKNKITESNKKEFLEENTFNDCIKSLFSKRKYDEERVLYFETNIVSEYLTNLKLN